MSDPKLLSDAEFEAFAGNGWALLDSHRGDPSCGTLLPQPCEHQQDVMRRFASALRAERSARMKAEAGRCEHGWRGDPPEEARRIADRCPTCGSTSLFIGKGGWLTCSSLSCSEPGVSRAFESVKQRAQKAEAERDALRDGETEQSISEWAQATFGSVGSNASVAARALKELAELLQKLTADDAHPGAAEELADVEIVFARLWVRLGADRQQEINAKMKKNRLRKWVLSGDGHGQHVPDLSTQGPSSVQAPSPETGQPARAPEASASLPLGHEFVHDCVDEICLDPTTCSVCENPRSAHLPTTPHSPQDEERKRLVEELREGHGPGAWADRYSNFARYCRCMKPYPCFSTRAADLLERDAKFCAEFLHVDGIYPYCANCGQDKNRHPA